MNSTILDNHNRLQTMCNKHDKLVNSLETQGQINKSKLEEELNYYKVKLIIQNNYCCINICFIDIL